MTREEIKPMSSELYPIGTRVYEDSTTPTGDTNWRPHRTIWQVVAHRECQDYPNAPTKLRCELKLLRQEDL